MRVVVTISILAKVVVTKPVMLANVELPISTKLGLGIQQANICFVFED